MIVISDTSPPRVCASCGYHVVGLPIDSGVVRCPECGYTGVPVIPINRTSAGLRASLTGCAIALNLIVLCDAALTTVMALGMDIAVHAHTYFLLGLCPFSVLVLALPNARSSFRLRIGVGAGHIVLLVVAARMYFGTMAAQSYGAPVWVVAILVTQSVTTLAAARRGRRPCLRP